jgi:hypothetical protein
MVLGVLGAQKSGKTETGFRCRVSRAKEGPPRRASFKTHAPQTGAWGTPRGGVVGLGSLGELELAIGPFVKNKFKDESLEHPAATSNPR